MSADQDRKAPSPPPSRGRRRFLGAGGSAVPALVSLASTPALGATCFTPSRNLSQNTSLTQNAYIGSCTGSSVTTYKGGTGWPGGANTSKTSPFHSVFSGDVFWVKNSSSGNGGLRSCTLLEVMNLNTGTLVPPSGKVWCSSNGTYRSSFVPVTGTTGAETMTVAKHLIAAYLNCSQSLVPSNVLKASGTVPSCTDIWSDFVADGKYEVMASIFWGPSALVDYFISNAIAPA
ncbi:MAG: hypothetical protein U1F56_00415 [Rubrivivax sp.]